MTNLIAAAAFFVLIHLAVSGTPLRDRLVAIVREGPYMALFSLTSVLGLVWLGVAYVDAQDGPNDIFWDVTPATRLIQLALQAVAALLIVPGLTTRNPTAVQSGSAVDRPNIVRGMLRITRHPFLWGVAIYAGGHLLVNGDAASIIFFGSLLGLALFGTASIDAKRRRVLGARWDAFAAQTGNAPFLAIAQGRQHLSLGEIGWWRVLLAVGVWVALVFGHPYAFGVAALP